MSDLEAIAVAYERVDLHLQGLRDTEDRAGEDPSPDSVDHEQRRDAGGGDTRLVLSRDEIVEMLRVFLPESSNEARVVERIDTYLNRIVDLGFLRRMRAAAGAAAPGAQTTYEVRRILKAFVDAEWLAELDARLAAYQAELDGREEADRAQE